MNNHTFEQVVKKDDVHKMVEALVASGYSIINLKKLNQPNGQEMWVINAEKK